MNRKDLVRKTTALLIATLVISFGASYASATENTCQTFNNDILYKDSSSEVSVLQQWLITHGFHIPAIEKGSANYGKYGAQTKSAVINLQKSFSMSSLTGNLGPVTRSFVNLSCPVATSPKVQNKVVETASVISAPIIEQNTAVPVPANNVTVAVQVPVPPTPPSPTVSIVSPVASSTVSGSITVRANASGGNAIAGVQFYIDWSKAGAEDTEAPYSIVLNTRVGFYGHDMTNGQHVIKAVTRDESNNLTETSINVDIQNDFVFPVISDITISDIASTSVKIAWKTDEDSNTPLEYWTDAGGNNTTWASVGQALQKDHQVMITGLTPDTKYYFRAYSQDDAGNEAQSGVMDFTTAQ